MNLGIQFQRSISLSSPESLNVPIRFDSDYSDKYRFDLVENEICQLKKDVDMITSGKIHEICLMHLRTFCSFSNFTFSKELEFEYDFTFFPFQWQILTIFKNILMR